MWGKGGGAHTYGGPIVPREGHIWSPWRTPPTKEITKKPQTTCEWPSLYNSMENENIMHKKIERQGTTGFGKECVQPSKLMQRMIRVENRRLPRAHGSWAHWLHNPCYLGGPQCDGVRDKIRKGPQVGRLATYRVLWGGGGHFRAGDKISIGPQLGRMAT